MSNNKLPKRVPKGSPEGGQFTSDDATSMSADELKMQLQRELPSDDLYVVNMDESQPKFGSQEEIDRLLGEEFKGYKGQAAVDKLLQEKRGHIKGAFYRDDIGDIDLFWGNDHVGLRHIIKQRQQEKTNEIEREIHVGEVLSHINDTIVNGKFSRQNKRGDIEYVYNGYGVAIAPTYHGNKITYLLTAYKNEKSQK